MRYRRHRPPNCEITFLRSPSVPVAATQTDALGNIIPVYDLDTEDEPRSIVLTGSMHQGDFPPPVATETNNVGPEAKWISGFIYTPSPVPAEALKHGIDGQLVWTGDCADREGGRFFFHSRQTADPAHIAKRAYGRHYQGVFVPQG